MPGATSSGAHVLRLSRALAGKWRTDRHMQQCVAEHGRRVVRADVGTTPITMTCVAVDLDGPGHVASDQWRTELRASLGALFSTHPGGLFYETRNGARLVYAITPVAIATLEDAAQWSARYLALLAYLRERFGLVGDAACADFTRLFRLPRVVREPGDAIEDPLMIGDPEAIGVIELPNAVAPLRSPVSREPQGTTGERGLSASGDRGVLFRLLEARGLVLRPHGDDAFVIGCPGEARHSTGSRGDGSTLLYLPCGAGDGRIHCFHAGCAEVTHAGWRELLGAAPCEIEIAKIISIGIDTLDTGVRVVLRTSAPAAVRVVRVRSDSPRWPALWEAAGVEPPDDLELSGDLGAACAELRDRMIALEIDDARGNPVRRILPVSEAA